MTLNLALTVDQVKHAVEVVKRNKPVYRDMLDFYGRIFELQEASKSCIQIEPVQISEEICSAKAREKSPLIEIREFLFDEAETGRLFLAICSHTKESNPVLASDAAAILKAVGKEIKPGRLFYGFLDGQDSFFEKIAGEMEIAVTTLGFLSYNSLKPSLSLCAAQLSFYLNKEDPWLKGYCPICGSPPILSILEAEGDRSLICGFCWHSWSVRRVFCPFCENRDTKSLHYFYSEEEKEFRVDLCDCCKKYFKTLDSRKMEHLIYPPLEQISSLHLDYKAGEMGYNSGVQLVGQG